MKKQLFLVVLMFASTAAIAQQVEPAPALGFAAPQAGDAREDELYRDGTDYVNEGKWQQALQKFSQVAKLNGKRADGAMYWQAYSQNKLGQRDAALETIAALQKQHPRSTWIKDARALEIEVRAATGQSVAPQSESDEELKVYAINGLMSMDPEQAFPLLQKILTGNQPARIKEKALFVLAQSGSPKAEQLIGQIALGQAQPELQIKAIRQLGIRGDRKTLAQVYASSDNFDAKKEVLRSLGICGGKQQLLEAAKGEKDFELRKEAIRGLAVAGAREELRQLYTPTLDPQTKVELIRSTVVSGDSQLLANVLQSETDPEVKRDAIRTLGITGGSNVSATLVNIYNADKDRDVREAVAQALFIHNDAHSLVELAKKETDPDLRKKLVQKLSLMGGNKEAMDFLMQLLEK
jgi:HEAT repeat protein